jgi:hypothetical protein
MLELQEQRVT